MFIYHNINDFIDKNIKIKRKNNFNILVGYDGER